MIKKRIMVELTTEEIESPEPIRISLTIRKKDGDEIVTYDIDYPKDPG